MLIRPLLKLGPTLRHLRKSPGELCSSMTSGRGSDRKDDETPLSHGSSIGWRAIERIGWSATPISGASAAASYVDLAADAREEAPGTEKRKRGSDEPRARPRVEEGHDPEPPDECDASDGDQLNEPFHASPYERGR